MTKRIAILVCTLYSVLCIPASAKKPQQAVLTTEQEQQFTYYWYAARQAIEQERYPEAYSLLQFCNALKPNDAQTLYYLGVMYGGLGRPEEALDVWEQSYRLEPTNEALLDKLLRLYITQENWKKALEMQDAMDKVSGYDGYSAITRYRIYAMSNQPKKALKVLDEYLETDPENLRFMLFRLDVLDRLGAKPKVLYAAFEQILAIDPYNVSVLNNYAWTLATNGGDLNKAEQMSAITIREEPNNPTCLDTYGWILHLKGQDELALFYLNRALCNVSNESKTKEIIIQHIHAIR